MLEARDITFGYKKGHPVLEDFSAQFGRDERVCISAASGVGKTTLCRLLAGYLKPQAGHILLDGSPLPAAGVCPVQLIGQHPEHAFDPHLRIETSLKEGGPADEHLAESLGIKEAWMKRYPHELSGGELMRLSICRALMSHPTYVVADEISAMLDAVTQAYIWDFLINEAHARDMGIILVSHSPALAARVATRTLELGL